MPDDGSTWTKYDFATTLAATLAYMAIARSDAVGLAIFDQALEGKFSVKVLERSRDRAKRIAEDLLNSLGGASTGPQAPPAGDGSSPAAPEAPAAPAPAASASRVSGLA